MSLPREINFFNRVVKSPTFRSFHYRNYRLLWIGNALSHIGDFMQVVAQSWLVLELTDSPFLLGFTGFFQAIPRFIMGIFGGVIVDRMEKKRLLSITQTLAMTQAFVFWALIYWGFIRYWHIIILVTFLGAVNSINQTARQSLVNSLVPKEDLMNAISLNSMIINISRIIGPSIAGVIIAFLGIPDCFFINGVSFLAILYSLYLMDHRSPPGLSKRFNLVRDMTEGWSHIWHMKRVRYAIITTYIIGFFGQPYARFNSIFARDILKIGPGGFGLLMAIPGIGAFCSALVIASLDAYRYKRQRRLLSLGTFFLGFSLIVYSLSRNLFLSLFFLILIGGTQMVSRNSANVIVQSNTSSNLLGRTMGIFFLDTGLWSLGALVMGAEASIIGITNAVMIGGGICALSALALGSFSRDKKEESL